MKVKINDYVIEYEIIRKDNKNLYFRFDENCVLKISTPKYMSDEDVKSLIQKNSKAILKMYEDALERQEREEFFWYLGNPYNVVFDNRCKDIEIDGNTITCANEEALNEFYKQECERVFTEEINVCRKCFNDLPIFELKQRKMLTRWGVCNRRKKTITLNTELLKKDIELIDYVIIHEMAHFYEGNHSASFWKIVESIIPDYKEKRRKLRY